MKTELTDLLIDFNLAIESVSEVYFVNGFLTGFFVCAASVALGLYLNR